MKDLLVTIIQSVFKYLMNPTVWSRVAADMTSTSSPQGNADPMQRIQSVSEPDLRDINMGKALDLASQHIQLILETKRNEVQPSGVETLAIKAAGLAVESAIASPLPMGPRKRCGKESLNEEPSNVEQLDSDLLSDGSLESYVHINASEINVPPRRSVISISSQPSGIASECSTTTVSTDYISSTKSSDSSATSITSHSSAKSVAYDDMNSSGDSVEILSISSDATTASSSSSAFRDL